MNYTIRTAVLQDQPQALALLPELADFEVPANRNPDHLWQGDAKLLKQFFAGDTPNSEALVAVDQQGSLYGLAIYTLRPELLSGEPSAHLEVLVVGANARRMGLGQALINAAESAAAKRGATSMTLHVFGNNKRARGLYQSSGYAEELLRCYKPL